MNQAKKSQEPYAELRLALSYATRPGGWALFDPIGELHVGLQDSHRKLIWGQADRSGRAPLQGYTELLYAVAAANAVPTLLKERDDLRRELTRLRELANLSQGGMGDAPMTSFELASEVTRKLDEILTTLGGYLY